MRTVERGSIWRAPALAGALLALSATSTTLAATPTTLDQRSDAAALKAYDAYLGAVAKHEAAWTRSSDGFTRAIAKQCPNVLAAVNVLPPGSVSKAAITAFGEELSFDIELAFVAPDHPFQRTLARSLRHLRWSSAAIAKVASGWQDATQKLFSMPHSDLCADANALAASDAQQTPSGTLAWLASFGRASSAVSHGAGRFEQLITRFETRADSGTVKSINGLLNRIQHATKTRGQAAVSKLSRTLGLSS